MTEMLVKFCGEIALFALLVIKSVQIVSSRLRPLLKETQKELSHQWVSLHEKHAVLIHKKKNMATLFLQQEKQLALLSARLEEWQSQAGEQRVRCDQEALERAHKTQALEEVQYRNFLDKKELSTQLAPLISQLRTEMASEEERVFRKEFLTHTLASLKKRSARQESV